MARPRGRLQGVGPTLFALLRSANVGDAAPIRRLGGCSLDGSRTGKNSDGDSGPADRVPVQIPHANGNRRYGLIATPAVVSLMAVARMQGVNKSY